MAYKFIVDAQLPPALARYLSSLGEDAIHVLDADMMEAPDSAIWDLALAQQRIIISKDEDFQIRASVTENSPKLIWVRVGNTSKQAILQLFEKQWAQIIQELDNGEPLIELQ
jgi:predicted nuclease of predicted toxin-antitoxin system